ncbi:MAG: glycosyltransferase family 39 protein [Nitrospirae bacterium]|nr:glycosyltransferase family 39 protein [Nitrospirota bacterium]
MNQIDVRKDVPIAFLLLLATLAVYFNVRNYGFVSYDDFTYITKNDYIKDGLTWDSVKWAFSTMYFTYWHPLTWLSYLIDVNLFGFSPAGYHIENVCFHAVNSLLLYFFLMRATGRREASAVVAALFALHPINVESVAWVSDRKNVLSTFFWLASVIAYAGYVKRPAIGRYLVVLFLFVLGLMSKPMLVTLPFTLLILDYWPLGRLSKTSASGDILEGKEGFVAKALYMVAEKVPFFFLSLLSGLITLKAQMQWGAVASLEFLPMKDRLLNAIDSYAGYLYKLFWPSRLAAIYPFAERSDVIPAIISAMVLITITALTFIERKSRPYLLMGWLWFLVTLVPVIQIVQVGSAPMADRFAYVPGIGIMTATVWYLSDIASHVRAGMKFLAVATTLCLVILSILSFNQTKYWQNSLVLYKHASDVTQGNYVALNGYGIEFFNMGSIDDAIEKFSLALRYIPELSSLNEQVNEHMWMALARKGRAKEAEKYFVKSVQFKYKYKDVSPARLNKMMARAYIKRGGYAEACEYLLKALQLDGNDAGGFVDLGEVLFALKRYEDAVLSFKKAIYLQPRDWRSHYFLGETLAKLGRQEEATAFFEDARRLKPTTEAPGLH